MRYFYTLHAVRGRVPLSIHTAGSPDAGRRARARRRAGHTRVGWIWHPRAENGAADALVRELLWG
jgi:hypothetical protein